MKKVFIIVAVVVIVPIVVGAVLYGMYLEQKQKDYEEALLRFSEACEYVTAHQESFDIVSQYEIARLDAENNYIIVQSTGEYQNERDEVFEYGHAVFARIMPNGYSGVCYYTSLNSNYDVTIVYQSGIVSREDIYSTDETYIVNDNLYMYMERMH